MVEGRAGCSRLHSRLHLRLPAEAVQQAVHRDEQLKHQKQKHPVVPALPFLPFSATPEPETLHHQTPGVLFSEEERSCHHDHHQHHQWLEQRVQAQAQEQVDSQAVEARVPGRQDSVGGFDCDPCSCY